jgi:hypothetical protein
MAVVVISSSAVAIAGNEYLQEADPLFAARGESHSNVERAKKLYLKVVKDKSEYKSTRKLALDRYARLAVFEGEVNREAFGVKDSAKVFKKCIDVTEHLNPKSIGERSAEYTYWRAMCIGLWAAHASKPDIGFHFTRIAELKSLIEFGTEHYGTFDGFGFDRMLAGIYVRGRSVPLVNIFQPEEAIELIDAAIINGCDNYMNYILKGEALIALNRIELARKTLAKGINELTEKLAKGPMPVLSGAENAVFLTKMQNLLNSISNNPV